tara:strand:- start:963 stop:3719 length:2757 start_codon:yes stop_codon:yes gene_type:complete
MIDQELSKAKFDLESAEKLQKLMKEANSIIKSKIDVQNRLEKAGFSSSQAAQIQTPDFANRVGFPTYKLTNNNAYIKRLKDKVNLLEKKSEGQEAVKTSGEAETYSFDGGQIEVNYDLDRVQILFPGGRTDKETYQKLRKNGWVYSPTNKAFQRKVTPQAIRNAIALFGATKDGGSIPVTKNDPSNILTENNKNALKDNFLNYADQSNYRGIYDFNENDGLQLDWGKYDYSVSIDQQFPDYTMLSKACVKFNTENMGSFYARVEQGDKFNSVYILGYGQLINSEQLVSEVPLVIFDKLKEQYPENKNIKKRLESQQKNNQKESSIDFLTNKLGFDAKDLVYILDYYKKYYLQNKNQQKENFFLYWKNRGGRVYFDSLNDLFNELLSDEFYSKIYSGSLVEVSIGIYNWIGMNIKWNEDGFVSDYSRRAKVLNVNNIFYNFEISSYDQFKEKLHKAMKDFIFAYNYYVLGIEEESEYQKELNRQYESGEIDTKDEGISLYHLSQNISKPTEIIAEAQSAIQPKFITLQIHNPDTSTKYTFYNYEDANKKFRQLLDTERFSDMNYRIDFFDGEVLEGAIDCEPRDFFDGEKYPLTRHLNTFWVNVAKETEKSILSPEDIEFAKNLVTKYNLGPQKAEAIILANAEIQDKPKYEFYNGINAEYKNQYILNKAIEEFIDEKGDNHSDYSSDEKVFIRKYSGYGGLDKYGTTGKGGLFEYYTPTDVIRKMWGLAYKYGYNNGSVLEPSVGTGEFLQFAKPEIRVVGYEISKYSAIICRVLYPLAEIKEQPFEKVFIENNFTMKSKINNLEKFDLVIGNPPYGDFSVVESRYMSGMGEGDFTKARNYVEYFIRRGVDLLKPNGLLIYIVGSQIKAGGTMFLDSELTPVKEYLSETCELLDAYRLPDSIFERTSVTSDIIVIRKK